MGYTIPKPVSYADYIAENIDQSIEYSKYIAENIDQSIEYSNYIGGKSGPTGISGSSSNCGATGFYGTSFVGPQGLNDTSTWLGPQCSKELPKLDIDLTDEKFLNDKSYLKNNLEDYFPTLNLLNE